MALVWTLPDEPGSNVVIFGFGGPDLDGWVANSGGIYQTDELNSHVIGKYTPEKSK
ncbi:hypothetical protein SDC9_180663 [bioreactor metagenome]|uniref:Uncharacterized protein n=1 Tax=bioreactor metagenome TaxID=1076179 RepID=A0A645H561_9ZZZZ